MERMADLWLRAVATAPADSLSGERQAHPRHSPEQNRPNSSGSPEPDEPNGGERPRRERDQSPPTTTELVGVDPLAPRRTELAELTSQ